jgi:hypothetical protein
MFWKKKEAKKNEGPVKIDRLLYEIIGDEWKNVPQDSNHWIEYKAVTRPHEDNNLVCDVRVFDLWCAKEKKIKVSNYASLDGHPDLIVLEGWVDRKAKKGDIKLRKAA